MEPDAPTTRLAPSPTGSLHLGHARSFLLTWALARREGWQVQMRLEDLDRARCSPASSQATLETLAWLGIDHDGPVVRQSEHRGPYEAAMRTLAAQQRIFECELSRREIREAALAPHSHAGEIGFAPSLRPPPGSAWSFDRLECSHRFLVSAGPVEFVDELHGAARFDPSETCGDFVVWTRDGSPSYQLAVVVDDARFGVTEVVRGDDLLESTARQILLQRALGFPTPRWWHLPLVLDADGERLAKRHGATALDALRGEGATPDRICGLVCWWSGWIADLRPMNVRDLPSVVSPASLRELAARERDVHHRPRVNEECLRWLRSG